ncbi:MAG: NADH-quinone oxidoreductase subunit J [Chitinophagaceae bacterium]|nr:NADH-quinone oxidoreductase subunit J [Chitinophagaceae bacterium]
MSGSDLVFYILALMTLCFGVLTVTSRQIFRAAVYLLFCLLGVAGIYFWLNYQFLAAVQIVVYAGGIVVLILFSIFLTQQSGEKLPVPAVSRKFFSALAAFCALALVLVSVFRFSFAESGKRSALVSMSQIGEKMLSPGEGGYALPFEVISVLLLAALIGCIVIAIKTKPDAR